ncbi:predicted protein [Aspergillus terreus NIH2624]|uniref:DNA-directed RNA polymerase III RPC4 n=1 Tax=Aspergillus terreus (strain NIH 2624 / FGSC A1156) TaxID=341663 RepID=Q0CVF7_ASPTN|nr:uncharacterized protein ATEG_02327 [Aspergillus terreus NIH2624]EAU37289.1 predicted protein [Aspergillus terreus NIH2624]
MPPKAPPRRGAASSAGAGTSRPPATQTPTPAPTGTRAPVQRLQTLKKRTPSGSIGPSAARATPAGPSGDAPKPTLKYKPRAVGRRSKEEREAIEKLEAERHRERLAEAAAIQRGRGGHRGRGGGRGRGDGARRGRGGFAARFADSRASSMSRRSRSVIDLGSRGVSRDVSSDESDTEVRISIDQINLDSDDDETPADGKKGKMAVKSEGRAGAGGGERGLRPVRVERHEHEERVVSVNMESSSSKSAELREQAKAKAKEADNALFVPAEGAEPRVKEEPEDDEDRVMTDVAAHEEGEGEAGGDDGFLPKQKVKVRRKLSREPASSPVEPEPQPEETPAVLDPKSLLRTKEDVEEYERHDKDLELMRELLSREKEEAGKAKEVSAAGEQPEAAAAEGAETAAADGEKKDGEDAEDEAAKDKLAGHLFLVQFPPITPSLVVPDGENPAVEGAADATAPAPGDATDPAIKREEDVELLDDADDAAGGQKTSQIVTATDRQLRAGRVGKLNVHASGRVTMDWGGISFELDRATEVDFLQEALIVSAAPDAAEPEEENKVWAMGQLSGKFTVTPNWEEML